MLSPADAADVSRGQTFKRYVRAAAALHDLYEDTDIAKAVRVGRGAVGHWWLGAKPEPETIRRLAQATGLSVDELNRFIHYGGPPPRLPDPAGEENEAQDQADAAERSLRARPEDEASAGPRAPHETAGSGRA